jgi:dTDP-4-dehydrorhamnose reductase
VLKKTPILFTGGSGLLALNWAQAMRDRCIPTLGLHERSISLAQTFAKKIDLESVDRLMHILEEINCQVVVNTAGLASVEQCESEPALAHHVNVTIASNVAKACANLGIKLVHISTDHLFSGQQALVIEDQLTAPVNVYGKTKAEAERKVTEINPGALVIRTNFYGWGTGYRQSFSDMVIKELRLHREITLFQDVSYTPILIEYAAKTIHDLIDLKVSGIFHVVGDEYISKYEFGLRIAEKFGLDANKIIPGFLASQSRLTQRPFDMSLSNSKVRNLLGRPIGSIQEQIATLHRQELNGLAEELQKI